MNSVGAYNQFLEEKVEKLEETIIILKEKLSIYLDNDRVRAILPIGNSDRNTLTQEQKELLEETLEWFE